MSSFTITEKVHVDLIWVKGGRGHDGHGGFGGSRGWTG